MRMQWSVAHWRLMFVSSLMCAAVAGAAESEYSTPTKKELENTALPPLESVQTPENLTSLSRNEIRGWQTIGRRRKEIEKQLRGFEIAGGKKKGKPTPDDHFVVAIYHTSVATRTADVRFMKLNDIEGTAQRLAYFTSTTPRGAMRVYQILNRHNTEEEATDSVAAVREHYEARKAAYQAQLLRYLQGRQVQATSVRRC